MAGINVNWVLTGKLAPQIESMDLLRASTVKLVE